MVHWRCLLLVFFLTCCVCCVEFKADRGKQVEARRPLRFVKVLF